MNPGMLRETIEIYDRGDETQEDGYFSGEPKLLCTLRAHRTYAGGGRELWEGDAAKMYSQVSFLIRPREGLRAGMLVKCEGQWHEIMSVQKPATRSGAMTLRTMLKEAF